MGDTEAFLNKTKTVLLVGILPVVMAGRDGVAAQVIPGGVRCVPLTPAQLEQEPFALASGNSSRHREWGR